MPLIFEKYPIIKTIKTNSNIQTYLTRIEPIVKIIIPNDEIEYSLISEGLEKMKNFNNKIKIYDIIKENNNIYVIIDNNNEIISEFDQIILSKEFSIKKEGILKGQGNPVTKKEILNLLDMEKSMCKINYEIIENKEIKEGKGTGFFCEICNINNFPIKYGLFTNNHILDESKLKSGNIINIEIFNQFSSSFIEKTIKIDDKRKKYTNKDLDYTCIELFESDGIKNFFKIDPILFSKDKMCIKNSDIFILQYPKGDDLAFSYGKILLLEDKKISHSASTKKGSSGSPIIRRCKQNYIIALHYGGYRAKKVFTYNLATLFDSILHDIEVKNKYSEDKDIEDINKKDINSKVININKFNTKDLSEISCLYIAKNEENEIQLLHDFRENVNYWKKEEKKAYLETKELNTKIFQEKLEFYGSEVKIDFKYKLITYGAKELKVKYIFKENLTKMSYMSYKCSSLKSIDLSKFDSSHIIDMSNMFNNCSSLESINFSNFNASKVINTSSMFHFCSSLKSLDLSSFNTCNNINMGNMFNHCSKLESINLSSFDTSNVNDMNGLFNCCLSLNSLDLSTFNTSKVRNMSSMFYECSALKFLDLSSFNTTNVSNMMSMFYNCSSLDNLDLHLFNTINVSNMNFMFYNCSSLASLDLSSFNTNNTKDLNHIFEGCQRLNNKNIKVNSQDKLIYLININ